LLGEGEVSAIRFGFRRGLGRRPLARPPCAVEAAAKERRCGGEGGGGEEGGGEESSGAGPDCGVRHRIDEQALPWNKRGPSNLFDWTLSSLEAVAAVLSCSDPEQFFDATQWRKDSVGPPRSTGR